MKNEVAKAAQQVAVAGSAEAVGFIQLIERASRDPSVDMDKMERLMQMHERMIARNAETSFNQALAELQTELPEIPERGAIKNRSGGVQSRYALWEDLNQIIKPILSKHGFSLSFLTGNGDKTIIVTGVLRHSAGHSVSSTLGVPLDMSGSKNEVQGLGSSTSYGKRYVAAALLNLTSRGEDNDGGGSKKLGESQLADFDAAISEVQDKAQWQALWDKITEATTAAGDVESHELLRGKMAAKYKGLK